MEEIAVALSDICLIKLLTITPQATDTAEAGVAALESFIKECGLPTKLSRLKSTVEITPEVLRQVADTCNIIKAGPRELSRDEIYEILMECL